MLQKYENDFCLQIQKYSKNMMSWLIWLSVENVVEILNNINVASNLSIFNMKSVSLSEELIAYLSWSGAVITSTCMSPDLGAALSSRYILVQIDT